jgi:hypothetical protein
MNQAKVRLVYCLAFITSSLWFDILCVLACSVFILRGRFPNSGSVGSTKGTVDLSSLMIITGGQVESDVNIWFSPPSSQDYPVIAIFVSPRTPPSEFLGTDFKRRNAGREGGGDSYVEGETISQGAHRLYIFFFFLPSHGT